MEEEAAAAAALDATVPAGLEDQPKLESAGPSLSKQAGG